MRTIQGYYAQKGRFPADEEGPILIAQADGKGAPMVRRETAQLKARRGKGDKKTRKKEASAIAAYTDYARYLEHGWPIDTGVTEGTCRYLVKDRMELSGMRWSVLGAEAILALRSVNENGDWDDFHEYRRTQRHQRLYDTPKNRDWFDQVGRLEIN